MASADNAGLREIIDVLAPVVQAHQGVMSRAVSGNSHQMSPSRSLRRWKWYPFPLRRIDASDATSTCRGPDRDKLPHAELSHQHTTAVFVDRMGFTQREVTALMGAHTLGRADADASGYDGVWVRNSATWDNSYYQAIIRRPWVRETNGNGQHLWRDPENSQTLMLNTDMALAFEVGNDLTINTLNCRTGRGGQRANRCSNTAINARNVQDFADDEGMWLSEFSRAWIKLQELGYDLDELSFPEGPSVEVDYGRSCRSW